MKGFTLFEVLVAVIIISILAAVAIPTYNGIVERQRGEVCINHMRLILSLWEKYNFLHPQSPYDPGNALVLSKNINLMLGTRINEKYFGNTNNMQTGFFMDYFPIDPADFLNTPRYEISAFRLGGQFYKDSLSCRFYPKGRDFGLVGVKYYVWSGSWHWRPDNE